MRQCDTCRQSFPETEFMPRATWCLACQREGVQRAQAARKAPSECSTSSGTAEPQKKPGSSGRTRRVLNDAEIAEIRERLDLTPEKLKRWNARTPKRSAG